MEYSSSKFSEAEIKEILSYYVSSIDKPVFYVYDTLPDEQWATLAGAYSRTHIGFRQRLLQAIEEGDFDAEEILEAVRRSKGEDKSDSKIQEKSRKFIQKWIQDYGHNSLKELSHARICIEGVSDLVGKDITGRRLTSPIVKSSRYIDWTAVLDTKKIDKNIASSKYASLYSETLEALHEAYAECTIKVTEYVERTNVDYFNDLMTETPDEEKEVVEAGFRKACKGKSFDASRYLLTASMPTSMALSMNLRTLEHMITRLLSNPLAEANYIGQMLLDEGRRSVFPVFLGEKSHAKRDECLIKIETELSHFVKNNFKFEKELNFKGGDRVELLEPKIIDDTYISAAIAYRYSNGSFEQVFEEVKNNPGFTEKILDIAYKDKERFTQTLREVEHNGSTTFETLMDYGGYRDVHRHRMGTLTRQLLTTFHSYETPALIIESGCKEIFDKAMKKAHETYLQIYKDFPYEAQFIVPFAYKYRTMYSWNPRQIQYFIELRSTPQGHESYRGIAQEMHKKFSVRFPYFSKYINCNYEEVQLGRLKQAIAYFKKLKEEREKNF